MDGGLCGGINRIKIDAIKFALRFDIGVKRTKESRQDGSFKEN